MSINRRQFVKAGLASLPMASCVAAAMSPPDETAWQRLLAGNRRFVEGQFAHPNESAQRRIQVSQAQHPHTAILTCADSRVPPEIIFDQGLGDLFVIRVAGNIVDAAVLGSLEYAVAELEVGLVVVLGHSHCGAVKAAVEKNREAHIATLARAIAPAVALARKQTGDVLENAIRENVRQSVRQLSKSRPILAPRVTQQTLTIIGAGYRLETGIVTPCSESTITTQERNTK